jgi:hypothetical protein
MGLKRMAVVDMDRPIIAELDESAQELSWKPHAVSVRGIEATTLTKGTMGVVIHVHLKKQS